jgi:hypothetical protein
MKSKENPKTKLTSTRGMFTSTPPSILDNPNGMEPGWLFLSNIGMFIIRAA